MVRDYQKRYQKDREKWRGIQKKAGYDFKVGLRTNVINRNRKWQIGDIISDSMPIRVCMDIVN